MATRLPTASQNAAADAVAGRCDAGPSFGTMQVRTGTQPTSANDAATGTLLVTFTLEDPAFGAASSGVATADTTPDISAIGVAAGTAGWFRALDSTGATVLDGAVGAEMTMSTTTISIGLTVTLTDWTVTMPGA